MPRKPLRYEPELEFRIPEPQAERLRQWIFEIETKVAKRQIETGEFDSEKTRRIRESLERGEPSPYYGACGGAYTYSFTPTGIGTIIKVENVLSGDVIDLTDYKDW